MIVEYQSGGQPRRLQAVGLDLDAALSLVPDDAQLLGVTWA